MSAAATATATATATETAPVAMDFAGITTSLQSVASVVKDLIQKVKLMERQYAKALKAKKTKKTRKPKEGGAATAPSGFAKPTKLSNELCAFLNLAEGTELPRTEVTRQLNAYIKENGLQNPEDKRTILPDAKLKKLLAVKADDKVTYFNLQTFMKPHFTAAAKGQ